MNRKKLRYIILAVILIVAVTRAVIDYKRAASVPSGEAYRDMKNLVITRHARCRMSCRGITEKEIRQIIATGKLNTSRSGTGSKGDSTFAIEGYSDERQHIRIVVAPGRDKLVVITCIDLDREWQCDCN